ncbi:MAG: acriflavin resistance protein [Bacteroidetes bacterium GWF2_42_66]|nr:MAG: acriflavin resistance protein [Bacteroidetes bacterium GWA2_42_15]OFX99159.1 MAG: acriflavin resistance protein [Bacteroidetes bacterium GWE2_42_39]OFY40555.1 MAG: acriflavin resistance protein [Bacteroidetes bacterium GWF2_42_66]HBL74506.1 acriflavin resistance protein [Prolixibacteraceae bacterium]HCR91245.1 acriflavin resistance protein [Prolixibacteraceae bacterium]
MTLSDLSIKRPVMATVFAIAIVLFGVVGFMSLGIREYPSVDPPVVTVSTSYPGANAEIIESQITEPIEESINSIDGIKTLSSVSSDGRSSITIEFDTGRDLDNAANDVRDKVAGAVSKLPPDAEPPVVSKADADAQTILTITVQSSKRSLLELSEIGNNIFKERLQTISGVSSIRIWGERKYAMRIELNPSKMESYGLTPTDVSSALSSQNVELPAGRLEGENTEYTIRALGRLNTPEELSRMIIAKKEKVLIRLSDLGTVRMGAENERTIMRGNNMVPMIGIALQPQPGANYIEIVDEAFRRIENIKKEMPEDIFLDIALDTTISIRKAVSEVKETIFISFMLVLLVVFFFLRSWRTTMIPIIAIPISLIGTYFVLYIAGYSINVLTLLGTVLATGLVVDDAIVVLENIYTKVEKGMSPLQAAFKGSREVFFAVISTSVSLICVFLPIFFLQGLTGRLFREFAMVVASSILISTFVSLSLTPMMSSRILRKSEHNSRLMEAFKNIVDFLISRYSLLLKSFMKRRWLSFPVVLIIAGLIALFGASLQQELAPMEDKSRIRLAAIAPEGTSYEAMDAYQKKLSLMMDTLSEKEFLMGITAFGGGSSSATNSASVRISLLPPAERKRSQMEIAQQLSQLVKKYNFAQTLVVQEPTISASRGGRTSLPVQFVIQAPDLQRLRKVIPEFMEKAQADPTFDAVTIDLKFNKPEYSIEILRDKALDMGVSVSDIARTIQTYLSEQRIGYFIKDGKQYYVIASANKENRNEPFDLTRMAVRNRLGEMVTLDNLVKMKLDSRPPQLLRFNRYVSATVSAAPAEGKTIGDGIDAMRRIADEVLDDSFSTALTGSASDFAESSGNIMLIFIFALILVYLTLAVQFESFRDPLTIMFTVPLALAGALMSLYFLGHTLNIFSEIGIIVLVGIVTKNGILIVEFANQKREQGLSIIDAAMEASVQRFRPILMTSLATVLGALPIALALGDASTSRIPMGISIIGGLIFSLILTLFIIPSLYTYIADKSKRVYAEEVE